MTCDLCHRQMTQAEAAAYRNRCEDCWCIPPLDNLAIFGAAMCYSSDLLGDHPPRMDGMVVHKDSHS